MTGIHRHLQTILGQRATVEPVRSPLLRPSGIAENLGASRDVHRVNCHRHSPAGLGALAEKADRCEIVNSPALIPLPAAPTSRPALIRPLLLAHKVSAGSPFSPSTCASNGSDKIGMAASVEQGTARKHVRIVNARTQRQSMFTGDSRKDGTSFNPQPTRKEI